MNQPFPMTLMLLLVTACALAPPGGEPADEQAAIELRRGYPVYTEGCIDCTLHEVERDGVRRAYYAHASPDCLLTPKDIEAASGRRNFILLDLTPAGKEHLMECLRVEPGDDYFMVLVSVQGVIVGDSLFHGDMEGLTVEGSTEYGRLKELFPEERNPRAPDR